MKRMLKAAVALTLALAMLFGAAPTELMGEFVSRAKAAAVPASAVTPDALAHVLPDAEALKAEGLLRTSGDWQYVLLQEEGYAVIAGYTGSGAASLQIPDLLDGYDVVGVMAGALWTAQGITEIGIPGNVQAMAPGRFRPARS